MSRVLVTGAAGFIGFHLSKRLLETGHAVVGIDNLNSYYDVSLKHDRLAQLKQYSSFEFALLDLADREQTAAAFQNYRSQIVFHLAAQAGVRYSLQNPYAYVDSNIVGFTNVLEGCRHSGVKHLIFASSSSVYGANQKIPFSVQDNVDRPVSLYAATKKANELMAYTYSHLYQIPTTGLRFFTVYGPWGRPDMALFLFTKSILAGEPIAVFNYGRMKRDFTYVDDVVEGLVRIMAYPPAASVAQPPEQGVIPPYKLYNIGNNQPVELIQLIETLEQCLGKTAVKNMLPMQPGDIPVTYAEVDDLVKAIDFKPETSVEVGVKQFVDWYCSYYSVVKPVVKP